MVKSEEFKGSIPESELYGMRESLGAIRSIAEDASQHQWLHRETADALDRITLFARIGLGEVTSEEVDDFPP